MSIEYFSEKYFELINLHIRANSQATQWQENLMYNLADVFTHSDSKKVFYRANRLLKLSIGKPNKHVLKNENTRLYWNSLNNRWIWVNEELKRIKSFSRLKGDTDYSAIARWLSSHANQVITILNYINRYALEKDNIDLDDPDGFIEVYSYRLEKKVSVAMMQETLSLSDEQRELARKTVDREVAFFLEQLEQDWSEKLEVYKKNYDICDRPSNELAHESNCEFYLCSPNDVQSCLDATGSKLSSVDKNAFTKITEQNGVIQLTSVPEDYSSILDGFRNRFPNIIELADLIENNLNLMTLGGTSIPLQLSSRPIILDGDVGIGKTMALRYLARVLGAAFKVVGCAELTNGFDLSGQSKGWSSAKMGLIAQMLLCEQKANAIIVLDEIDKCHNSQSNFPPTQALYTLLERETSAHFIDEFVGFEINASQLNWLGTSNYFNHIPEPIRDRARRISIPAPDTGQRITIVKYIYSDLIKKNDQTWGRFFVPKLSDEVAFMFASATGVSVRGMRDILLECLAKVASCSKRPVNTGSQKVTEEFASKIIGLRHFYPNGNRPIGFIH